MNIDELNPKGKKRPIHPGPTGKNTPVPYTAGALPFDGQWSGIDGTRAREVADNFLCFVCGLDLGENYVFALLNGQPVSVLADYYERMIFGGAPSVTYGHPNCILQAALYCPHLKRQKYPACTKMGKNLTLDELKELARKDREQEKVLVS